MNHDMEAGTAVGVSEARYGDDDGDGADTKAKEEAVYGIVINDPDTSKITEHENGHGQENRGSRCAPRGCNGCRIGMGLCLSLLVTLILTLAIFTTKGFPNTSSSELQGTYNAYSHLDSGSGYPVWADVPHDDGTALISMAGVEMMWSQGLIFPPLQGWTGAVNPHFNVLLADVDMDMDMAASGNNITETPTATTAQKQTALSILTPTATTPKPVILAELKQHASSLYYMKSAGYILVNYFKSGSRDSVLIPTSEGAGETRTSSHLSNVGLFGSNDAMYTAIPSRDGSVLAAVSWFVPQYERVPNLDYFAYAIQFKVAFVDAVTMETMEPGVLLFDAAVALYEPNDIGLSRQWPFFYWADEESRGKHVFHVTDLVDLSIAFPADGSGMQQDVAVPTCVPFPTSSGPVRRRAASNSNSNGTSVFGYDRVVVDEAGERIEVIENWEVEEPYCTS